MVPISRHQEPGSIGRSTQPRPGNLPDFLHPIKLGNSSEFPVVCFDYDLESVPEDEPDLRYFKTAMLNLPGNNRWNRVKYYHTYDEHTNTHSVSLAANHVDIQNQILNPVALFIRDTEDTRGMPCKKSKSLDPITDDFAACGSEACAYADMIGPNPLTSQFVVFTGDDFRKGKTCEIVGQLFFILFVLPSQNIIYAIVHPNEIVNKLKELHQEYINAMRSPTPMQLVLMVNNPILYDEDMGIFATVGFQFHDLEKENWRQVDTDHNWLVHIP
jgi:hypothetical protein